MCTSKLLIFRHAIAKPLLNMLEYWLFILEVECTSGFEITDSPLTVSLQELI